jgi:hypothetical protein
LQAKDKQESRKEGGNNRIETIQHFVSRGNIVHLLDLNFRALVLIIRFLDHNLLRKARVTIIVVHKTREIDEVCERRTFGGSSEI